MASLSDFKRSQIVGARMVGGSVTKTVHMFGISRGTVSKVMIAFQKEKKTSQQSTSLTESQNCQRETVELYIEILERTVELRYLKLLLSLMNTRRTICPQKLSSRVAQKNILRKSCNSKTSTFSDKCFKAFVYGPFELVSWPMDRNDFL